MNLILDGVILLICVTCVILGTKRGFIKSLMGSCTLIAALFVAYAFSPALTAYIEQQPFIRNISSSITDTIKSLSENEQGSYDLLRLFDEMPDAFQQIIDRYNADEEQLTDALPSEPEAEEEDVHLLSEMIAEPVARAISGVLAFLALFVGTVFVLKFLTWILDLIFQLPVLKTANSMLGFLFGVLSALLWAWVLSSLSVTLAKAMFSISPELFPEDLVEKTVLVKLFSSFRLQDLTMLLP